MMRRTAGYGLGFAAFFLSIVSVMVGSPGLFYMGTAVIATILAGRLQAWLSVRYLRIERIAPATASAGELVTVEVLVWSEKKIRRPLIFLNDHLPKRMVVSDRSPSLPIAPSFDMPVRSQYQFRPVRRGKFRWSGITAVGSDALGLASFNREYLTEVTELVVVPSPIPVAVDLPTSGGIGISEAGSGQAKGGLEPRGIREYVPGDPLRHVHWRSSARAGTLLVKEFEAGSQAIVGFLLQRKRGTDVGDAGMSSLDLMCGHAAFLSRDFKRIGADTVYPQLEVPRDRTRGSGRNDEIDLLLAGIVAEEPDDIARDLLIASRDPSCGTIFYLFVAVEDPALPSAVATVISNGVAVVVLLYDADAFRGNKGSVRARSAVSTAFIDTLVSAGAKTHMIPVEDEILNHA